MSAPVARSGRDLKDQFDYLYSVDVPRELQVLQVAFGQVFGFVSIFSQVPGGLEAMDERLAERCEGQQKKPPFKWLSSNRERDLNTARLSQVPRRKNPDVQLPVLDLIF